MPEYHPGTQIELGEGVAPLSGFRCAIPNVLRYRRKNRWTVDVVAQAAYEGDFDLLETLLSLGDEANLFNGDLNEHVEADQGFSKHFYTALHLAAASGQAECVELLLRARADPHMKESMPHGRDPDDGCTALDLARKSCWDDCVALLESAEKSRPYGWYQVLGARNNSKCYDCWEFGNEKPAKSWFAMRPGAAPQQGLDPTKYGGQYDGPEDVGQDIVDAAILTQRTKKLPIALIFPGEGSQYVKMMSFVAELPPVADMLQKAKGILGYDVFELCMEGPDSRLEEIAICHAVMFIANLAGVERLKCLREEAVDRARVMAGLNLGEYSALCAAGVFSFEDGLRIVKVRGEALQAVSHSSKQLQISVAGLEKPKLHKLCQDAAEKEGEGGSCQITSELFPKGFAVAGTEKSICILKEMAEKAGAMQARLGRIAVANNSPLMKPAQEKLSKILEELLPRMKPPMCTVYMNATAAPMRAGTDPREIVEELKNQMTNPVLWEPSVKRMIREEGISEFYEVGPMKQLKAMMKRIDTKIWGTTRNVDV